MITKRDLEIEYRSKWHQPIPNSNFTYGEAVGWTPQGYLDPTDAIIYDITKNKALIWAENDQKTYHVPVKHLYKLKGEILG